MNPIVHSLFSEQDLDRIRESVGQAEGDTSGEVVPYVVQQSDDYAEAELRGALAFSLIPPAIFFVLNMFTGFWITPDALELALAILIFMAIGWLAAGKIPPCKRFFAGRALMERRTAQRAAEAFVSEEIFKTRDRTGILIFISVFERNVLVIGDSGISAKVGKEEWQGIVGHITGGIRSGRKADAIIEAMKMCSDLLKAKGFTARPDDTNELPNTLRTGV